MKNILKKTLCCAALAAGSGAFAAGPLDGAYLCKVTYPGAAPFDTYLAVVTNTAGVTATAPIAISQQNQLYGYGIGTVTTTSFNGRTNLDQPFAFAVNPQTLSFSGTLGVSGVAGPVTVGVSCTKIW